MKVEFTSLEAEPLVYFLLHSAAFVAGLGMIFFLLGLCFGGVTWGRYRKKNKILQTETDGLREEVADLKRKLAEQAMRPSTGPLGSPPPALLTEVLPKPSEIFPERSKTVPAPTAPAEPTLESLPSLPLIPELSPIPGITPVRTAKRSPSLLPGLPPPVPRKSARDDSDSADVEPFSFLLPNSPNDDAPEEEAHGHESPLGSIIHGEAIPHPAATLAPPSSIPESDPTLGLIFKEKPAEVDDLTRVQGISPALQNHLQELGIYRLQQIATWNQTHIREFSRRLAFKDRIERERWVEQAGRLIDG